MISGIVCPEAEPCRKVERRKGDHKKRRDETSMNTDFFFLLILKKKSVVKYSISVRFFSCKNLILSLWVKIML